MKKHQIIDVHHQSGVQSWECDSFADAAGLVTIEYATLDDAVADLGEDVPEKLKKILEKGPAIAAYCGDREEYFPAAEFDAEEFAMDFLGEDLSMMFVIDSAVDAEYYATKYSGHEQYRVQEVAAFILEKFQEVTK